MAIIDTFGAYRFFALALLLGALGLGAVMYAKQAGRRTARAGRPFWHYLLIWPLLTEQKAAEGQLAQRALTRREVWGWVLVVVLLVAAMVFGL